MFFHKGCKENCVPNTGSDPKGLEKFLDPSLMLKQDMLYVHSLSRVYPSLESDVTLSRISFFPFGEECTRLHN